MHIAIALYDDINFPFRAHFDENQYVTWVISKFDTITAGR